RVDLDTGRLALETSKNDRPRVAYLPAATLALLREQRSRVEDLQRATGQIIPFVFVHDQRKGKLRGRRIVEFSKQWRAATRRAGLGHVLLHDLRRSGVRAMVRAGIPESVAMRVSGHETRAVFDRYDITSDQDLRDAAVRRAQMGHNPPSKVVALSSVSR